jgi:prepilin-type N-terminal cleavage/methylation domain-containing protein
MMPNHANRPATAPRRGLSLIELLIVLTILAIVGGLMVNVLIKQQRFNRALTETADSRARMRDIATILPTDLRGASSIGQDLLAIGQTSMQFRSSIGSSVLCAIAGASVIELPPTTLASGQVLTAWINPPAPGDIAFIYDDGLGAGNVDDSWRQFIITDTTSASNPAWCPSIGVAPFTAPADDGARRYRITLDAALNPVRIKPGAPIRFAREVRYSLFAASDANWYVGYETCTPSGAPGVPGACANREILAGPVRPAATDTAQSGLYFIYYAQDGTPITNVAQAASIARIGIGLRTSPMSMSQALQKLGGMIPGRDSLRMTVGIRNRI